MNDSATIQLAKQLIARPSVTPDDEGCQKIMIKRLAAMEFNIERLRFAEVDNFWARRGNTSPLFVFAGHTDVVPTGPLCEWDTDPFTPTIKEGQLYGRGAADMKSSLAAMITACEAFIAENPDHKGSIGFLITSDEEGPAKNGTLRVIEHLQQRDEKIDACLVGEPSSTDRLGDIIKNGRRGSLGGTLTVHGEQGHIAYPHLAKNPIHLFAPALQALCTAEWDQGNEFFPPTSFQVSNINAGTGVTNVIPGTLIVEFNFRFSTELTDTAIREKVEALLDEHQLKYTLDWNLSGQPFLTEPGTLIESVQAAIRDVCDYETELSTSGGTSDGRFIAPTGAQVIELGPCNASIHKINENVSVADINVLSKVYQKTLESFLER